MKIILSNAPWYSVDFETGAGLLGCRAGSRWPHMRDYRGSMVSRYQPFPFFLATASAMLKNEGFDAIIRDSIVIGESYGEYYDFIVDVRPDLVVLEVSTPSIENDLMIAREIKSRSPGTRVLFVGLHAPLEDPEFLDTNETVDFTIYGEYEHPLLLLARALSTGSRLSNVPNLVYRDGGGTKKTEREALRPISEFPWPDRDSLPSAYYDGCGGMEGKELQILTSRGCLFKCNFCVLPQIVYAGSNYRMRDPQDVIDEILSEIQKVPYTHFYIDDDTININRNHFLKLCYLISESGLSRYPWACMGRGDLMDDEMLLALKKAGCFSIKYGVESFDRDVLARSGKSLNLEKTIETIRKTEELGIKVHLTYCLGMLGDTNETVKKTIRKSLELRADSRQYSIATPFPGSRLWKEYREHGLLCADDPSRYDANHATAVDRKELPADTLIRLKKEADRLNRQQLLKNTPSPFRTREFSESLLIATTGVKKALIMGDSRPPVIKRIAELLIASGVKVSILMPNEQLGEYNRCQNAEVIPVLESGWSSAERALLGMGGAVYDGVVISLRSFVCSDITAVIEAARRISTKVVVIYGHAKIEEK